MVIDRGSSIYAPRRFPSRAATGPLTVALWVSVWLAFPTAVQVAAKESQAPEQTESRIEAGYKGMRVRDLNVSAAKEECQRWSNLRAAWELSRWLKSDPSALPPCLLKYKYVKFVGNRVIGEPALQREIRPLRAGYPRDTTEAEFGCNDIQRLYQRHGYNEARVTIIEGKKLGDVGLVYRIDEGPRQRIRRITFTGNAQVADDELRRKIKSKPAFLWIVPGYIDTDDIEDDVNSLTAHYRDLGYFRARVSQEVRFDENREWAEVIFVIDEGARYGVRKISFVGNTKFSTEELMRGLKLEAGEYFDHTDMKSDRSAIEDKYGSAGYLLAEVKLSPRFLEEPHRIDLIYEIQEGSRYRVGRIRVPITCNCSDLPIPAVTDCVGNCITFRPGEIADILKIRNSERRLRSSGWFRIYPLYGMGPKITFSPPESTAPSSDTGSGDIPMDFEIHGELIQRRQTTASELIDTAFTALVYASLDRAAKRLFLGLF